MKSTLAYFRFLVILAALVQCAVHAQQICLNPNGNAGDCISVYDCSSVLEVLRSNSVSERQRSFLRESQCTDGSGRRPHVCCTEDTNYLIRTTPTPATTPSTNSGSGANLLPREPACGPNSLADKIYNGNDTQIDDFVWMVLLEYRDAMGKLVINCGGSLINNRYILTAAHCVKGAIEREVGRLTQVRVGEYDLSTEKDCVRNICNQPVQEFEVEQSIVHPDYDPDSKDKHNDIALLRLSRPVELNEYIQPVCLPLANVRSTINTNEQLVVSGWGRTLQARQSNIKQRLDLPVKDPQACANKFATRKISIIDSQICAGGEFSKDSCDGDSGGPLMRQQNVWYLEGVVSYGNRCGLEGWPGVYTRVSSYIDWIEATIRP